MLENVTITITGPISAISQLLAAAAKMPELPGTGDQGQPYSGPNTGALVSLDAAQFAAFFEGMDPRYQEGIRLIEQGAGTVSWKDLQNKGIRSPGHFKSRTSLRAKKVLGLSKRVQFASYFYTMEEGQPVWYLKVTPTTLDSMRAYFRGRNAAKSPSTSKGQRSARKTGRGKAH